MSSAKNMMNIFIKITYKLNLILNYHILNPLEMLFAPSYDQKLKHPPVFIIGPPRSGSTLLFQVLTDAFDFGFMSNLHSYFFGAPSILEAISHRNSNSKTSSYSSQYGRTKNLSSPSEIGEFWYRFFRRNPAYVTLKDVEPKKMLNLRRAVASFIKVCDKPVLFKNLYVSLRLEPIVEHIPEAIFIIIKRDELDNARSILKARMDIYHTYEKWFSLKPPSTIDLEQLVPEAQVVQQIRLVQDQIRNDLPTKKIAQHKLFKLDYEELCRDPIKQIELIKQFLYKNNVKVKENTNTPTSFPLSTGAKIDPAMLERLEEYIQNGKFTHGN